jgi:hypothetical protein
MSQPSEPGGAGIGNAEDLETAINRRRIEQIYSAQETVEDVEGRIEERRTLEDRPLSDREQRRLMLVATRRFVGEVEPLLRPDTPPQMDTQSGRDYWRGEELGVLHLPDGTTASVDSLEQYRSQNWPLEYRYTETTSEPPYGRREEEHIEHVYPPLRVSRTAVRMVRLFLADVGLDISPGEADSETAPY